MGGKNDGDVVYRILAILVIQ